MSKSAIKRIPFFLICFLFLWSQTSQANDVLAEVTLGNVWTKKDSFVEMGFDLEYFPSKEGTHFSFGVATEVEFEKENEFYAGPLLSLYLSHFKLFLTSGLQGHESYWRSKTRIGLGYDIILPEEYILIPNVTFDFIDRELHPGFSLGLARIY